MWQRLINVFKLFSQVTKKAPAKKATTAAAKTRQTKLTVGASQASTRAPRAAAKSARSKVQAAVSVPDCLRRMHNLVDLPYADRVERLGSRFSVS